MKKETNKEEDNEGQPQKGISQGKRYASHFSIFLIFIYLF